ncbi:hydrogenase expression protein HypC [Anaerosporomusa subterranea]|uniref:Hydrogenase maturation factor HypA n=1 Tax=Anaerosporomusa subterranea TaxID=1794912 RepID=A0A154BSH1_ANASB|nr:hydrogenase maturation nickel metallochaperone HypA [Anaerosporomusa subterranea]KYZ76881.1 hydrogenase expression protein HypC [Anaerosporomusa subterranea]
MHEMAIAASVLDIVLETAAAAQANRVVKVKLLIGEMAGVSGEALRFCFDSITEGTLAAGAALCIDLAPLIGCCRECGSTFPVSEARFICPACSSLVVDVLSGQELRVENIEVED